MLPILEFRIAVDNVRVEIWNDKHQGTLVCHVSPYTYIQIIINHRFLIGNEFFFKGFPLPFALVFPRNHKSR